MNINIKSIIIVLILNMMIVKNNTFAESIESGEAFHKQYDLWGNLISYEKIKYNSSEGIFYHEKILNPIEVNPTQNIFLNGIIGIGIGYLFFKALSSSLQKKNKEILSSSIATLIKDILQNNKRNKDELLHELIHEYIFIIDQYKILFKENNNIYIQEKIEIIKLINNIIEKIILLIKSDKNFSMIKNNIIKLLDNNTDRYELLENSILREIISKYILVDSNVIIKNINNSNNDSDVNNEMRFKK